VAGQQLGDGLRRRAHAREVRGFDLEQQVGMGVAQRRRSAPQRRILGTL